MSEEYKTPETKTHRASKYGIYAFRKPNPNSKIGKALQRPLPREPFGYHSKSAALKNKIK